MQGVEEKIFAASLPCSKLIPQFGELCWAPVLLWRILARHPHISAFWWRPGMAALLFPPDGENPRQYALHSGKCWRITKLGV